MNKKINLLRKKFKKFNIDGYIVSKNDDYFTEYSKINRLEIISNFTGSAGLAIILKNKNYLFTDGRYTIQSQIESGNDFKIVNYYKIINFDLVKNLTSSIFLISALSFISFLNYFFVEKRAISQEKNFAIKKFLIIYMFVSFAFFGFTTSNDTFLKLNPLNSKVVTYALNSQSIIQQNGISCENRDVESTCFFDTMNTNLKIYA